MGGLVHNYPLPLPFHRLLSQREEQASDPSCSSIVVYFLPMDSKDGPSSGKTGDQTSVASLKLLITGELWLYKTWNMKLYMYNSDISTLAINIPLLLRDEFSTNTIWQFTFHRLLSQREGQASDPSCNSRGVYSFPMDLNFPQQIKLYWLRKKADTVWPNIVQINFFNALFILSNSLPIQLINLYGQLDHKISASFLPSHIHFQKSNKTLRQTFSFFFKILCQFIWKETFKTILHTVICERIQRWSILRTRWIQRMMGPEWRGGGNLNARSRRKLAIVGLVIVKGRFCTDTATQIISRDNRHLL